MAVFEQFLSRLQEIAIETYRLTYKKFQDLQRLQDPHLVQGRSFGIEWTDPGGWVPTYQLAQVNIGRVRASLEDPSMAGFVNRLGEINALADQSPGFVWRLQTPAGNATYLRPYDDDRILVNMSVWENVEALKNFVYRSTHQELLRQRQQWFEKFESAYAALWWVPAGHIPGVDEAKKRLAYLEEHGPTQFAFTVRMIFQADQEFQNKIDWGSFRACPAV